jgi:triacylglycerol esterase/lipase EstA (alpha/beta hydrolase family)
VASILVNAVVLAALAFAIGCAGYFASFLFMRAHVEPRPIASTLREMMREAFWVAMTQPIAPLWYLVGRRMGTASGVPVVFVHGYMQNRGCFVALARALAKGNVGPLYGFNYNWLLGIPESAKRLGDFVEGVCAEHAANEVNLVCHSMGGVIAMEYVHSDAGRRRVNKCVTIASPHAGVAYTGPVIGLGGAQLRRGCAYMVDASARPVAVPCLSIYSTHDNIVNPPATSALTHRGGTDKIVPHLGHLSLLFSNQVIAEVVRYLKEGEGRGGRTSPAPDGPLISGS